MPGRTEWVNKNEAERASSLLLLLSGATGLRRHRLRVSCPAALAGRVRILLRAGALSAVAGIIAGWEWIRLIGRQG